MLASLKYLPYDTALAGENSGYYLLLGYRQVDALMGRVDRLPSPEDWTIMEEALAAILDEAAARAQQQDKLKELDAAHEQSKSGVRSLLQMELFRLLVITAEVLVHD